MSSSSYPWSYGVTRVIDEASGTNITPICSDVFRLSVPIPPTPALPKGFSFNSFLVVDEQPFLHHAGLKRLFPLFEKAVNELLPGGVASLRYISVSHFESDECGGLNSWLQAAPNAACVCSIIGANASLNDFAIRPPAPLAHNATLKLGKNTVKWIDAPQTPHGWDNGFPFLLEQRVLFAGDLFTQVGNNRPALVSSAVEVLDPAKIFDLSGYFTNDIDLNTKNIHNLADLKPRVLCIMHGASFVSKNDDECANLLFALLTLRSKWSSLPDHLKANPNQSLHEVLALCDAHKFFDK